MKVNPDIDQCNNLWVQWHRASLVMVKARDKELRQADIPVAEAGAVYFLKCARKPINPRMLSHFLHRDPQQVSKLLDQMEENGLVNRVRDPKKRNMVRVMLTPKGEEAYQRLSEANVARIAIFSCLSPEECDHLQTCLDKLYHRALELIRSS